MICTSAVRHLRYEKKNKIKIGCATVAPKST
jgi:hypothetical protein